MQSRWVQHKETVRALRRQGASVTAIERQYGVPRSTLSGWFKDIQLSPEQRMRLDQNSIGGGKQGRLKGAEWNRQQKLARLRIAEQHALATLNNIELTDDIMELALAMLYWGEGAKKDTTAIGSSDPRMLQFTLTILRRRYGITNDMLRCDLHLRADQDAQELKQYWSKALGIPMARFKYASFDERTRGKKTYQGYKGVCLIRCGSIAIQRKLIYLYTLFYDKVSEVDVGT